MVAEESGHRPVWGLRTGSPGVAVKQARGVAVQACVRAVDAVVGLQAEPARLLELELRVPRTLDVDALVADASAQYADHFASDGVDVWYTRKFYESVDWVRFGSIPRRPIASIKLGGGLEADLLADARRFVNPAREAEYVAFGRPYKRVYCLHGPPGTGKTSLVMAIASELRRPVAIFNVDSLRDDTFIELLSNLPPRAVIMFEDVDALFKSRVPPAPESTGASGGGSSSGKGRADPQQPRPPMMAGGSAGPDAGGMTFSTLLNALDGVLHPRGAIIFMTTNHVDRLDPALHRPGRVNRMVEVSLARSEQVAELWRAAFPKGPAMHPRLAAAVDRADGVSPALTAEVLFRARSDGAGHSDTAAALLDAWQSAKLHAPRA